VVAPFSGTLGIIRAKVGDYIESGDSITTLQDLSEEAVGAVLQVPNSLFFQKSVRRWR